MTTWTRLIRQTTTNDELGQYWQLAVGTTDVDGEGQTTTYLEVTQEE